MPKPRKKENRGLPKRWIHQHGAYYFCVPKGLEHLWNGKKLFRLGDNLSEAYQAFSQRIQSPKNVKVISDLLDRYLLEAIPIKAPRTQIENKRQLKNLRKVFGDLPLLPFPPRWVYQYIHDHPAKVSAKREIDLLSHAFTKAVEWGYIDRHPFKGQVRITGEKPRTRYVEDWEILELFKLDSKRKRGSVNALKAYVNLKLLTGLRQGDLLRLKESDLRSDGIHVTTHKTKKRLIYKWSDELRKAVQEAKQTRPVDISQYLFCNKRGQCYVREDTGEASGFKSMWGRFMDRALKETDLKERFTEHDLRAKVASDAKTLERAQSLLAHVDSRTTKRIYRRKADIIEPE